MTRHNTVLLVIASGISCEFEDLGGKVFKDGSEIHCSKLSQMQSYDQVNLPLTWSSSTNALSVVAPLQQTVDTTDWELETSFGRARLRLSSSAIADSSLARLGFSANFSRHCDMVEWWWWWWRTVVVVVVVEMD